MASHFLLSAKARTLSLVQVARMSDEQADATFRALRWHETGGDPVCPHCGCCAAYEFRTRRLFKCKGCLRQFSVTSGTTFHGRKLAIRDYLMAIAIFANAAKGISALQLGRDLDVSYKTAFVLAHKLREAMAADQAKYQPKGEGEVDGAYFGGSIRQENYKADRKDRRLAEHQTGKRRVVVVMRERQGRSLPFVVKAEDEGVATVARRVQPGSTVYADEAPHWDALHARFKAKRINHSFAFSDYYLKYAELELQRDANVIAEAQNELTKKQLDSQSKPIISDQKALETILLGLEKLTTRLELDEMNKPTIEPTHRKPPGPPKSKPPQSG